MLGGSPTYSGTGSWAASTLCAWKGRAAEKRHTYVNHQEDALLGYIPLVRSTYLVPSRNKDRREKWAIGV